MGMGTLVENVDPGTINTPLRPLLRAFAASPYIIAPEREVDLQQFIEHKNLRIWLDVTTDSFDVNISGMMRRIKFPLRALERLWGYAYCYCLFFDLYRPTTQGRFIDLRENPTLAAARCLLLWAHEAEVSGVCRSWPEDTPRPDRPNYDRRMGSTNQVFLTMSGFILLHEVGHMALGHCDSPPANCEQSIAQEFQADQWAADWILGRWQQYDRNEMVFIQRSIGIAFALAALGGIEIYTVNASVRDHPNPAQRLLAFLDRWIPESNARVLPKKATAWKVGPVVLHTHFLKAGRPIDTTRSYPSFRQYLVEAQSYF
jgi:hypothetical protein